MRTLPLASALVLAPLLGSATAHAGDIGVVVTGEATLQPQLAAELEGWLREHGHPVSASPLVPEAINTLIDCFVLEDLGCARRVIDGRAKTETVVFARVEVTPNSAAGGRDITLTGYWLKRGHDAISERRICTSCSDEKFHTTADDLMRALAAEPPVGTDSPSAAAHAADAPAPTSAEEGSETEPGRSSRLLPMTLLGVGGAALLAGGVMVAIDEDPSPKGVQQADYLDTATGGVVLLSAGAVAVGAGLYLWLTHGTHGAPIAAASKDGGYVGWTGRF